MNTFTIGQKVTSAYQGVKNGTVIAIKAPFMGHAAIAVEYQSLQLGTSNKFVTVSRSFLERDFSAI